MTIVLEQPILVQMENASVEQMICVGDVHILGVIQS